MFECTTWPVPRLRLRAASILPFGRLIAQVMSQKPYRSANRVFLVVDNGSSHRGQRAADRLRARWSNIVLVDTPVVSSGEEARVNGGERRPAA